MQRGVIVATLDTPLGKLKVGTTHLEYFSPLQRAAQVERLRDLHYEYALQAATQHGDTDDEGPFQRVPRASHALLTGDFNFQPGSDEYRRLLAPFEGSVAPLCNAWTRRFPGMAASPTVCLHHSGTVPWTSDFVFATSSLRPHIRDVRVLPANLGSDHQPMLIEIA